MYPLKEPVNVVTIPSAPQNLTAVAGDGRVTLSWQAPESDGGSPITGYKVYWGTSSGSYTNVQNTGNVLTYTVTGLTNGQRYYFAVTAINSVGESAKSNEVSATPQSGVTVPSAPQNLVATPGDQRVALSWQAPASDGGSPITNYKIYRNGTLLATIGTNTSYVDYNVVNGVTYTYKVSAVNSVGEGPFSNEVSATPQAGAITVPSAPQNLQATPGNGNVTLSWQPPADNGGSPITGYKIYYGTSSGNYTITIMAGNITNYTITGLTNGQKYYFAVSAINGVGEGPKSNEISATPTGEQQQQPGKTPGFDVLVGICAIAVSMAVIAIWRRKSR